MTAAAHAAPDWIAVAGVVATVVAAVTTVGLAIFTAKMASSTRDMARATKKSVKVGTRAAASAESAAAAAQGSMAESYRARLDARSPRVVLILNDASLPMQQDQPPDPIVFPRDQDLVLAVRVRGQARNEGATTARVFLQGDEAQFLVNPLDTSTVPVLVDASRGEPMVASVAPGATAGFQWSPRRTLREWAERLNDPNNLLPWVSLEISVQDPGALTDAGAPTSAYVADRIGVYMAGRPIEPVPDASGQWRLANHMQRPQWRTERSYDGAKGHHPNPWWDRNDPPTA